MTKEELIRYGKDYLHDLETACCPISDIHKEFVREAINALEIVEEFEKAQIITGGRLNGRTYAYKCGLEDGKRKALEQQPSEDIMAIHTQGLDEGIRCAMCTNSMKSDTGCDGGCRVDNDMYKKVMDTIKNHIVPPVTPTHGWIPVSEKLPEESGNYLLYGKVVDYEENFVFIGEYDSDYEKFGYEENIYDSETLGFLDSEFCEYNKVIAWQPLPKPYEEKRGSENASDN